MSPRAGWFGRPIYSAGVFLGWLLLQGSLGIAQLLTAAVLALVLPRLAGRLLDRAARPLSLRAAGRLALIVPYDIVVANITVARIVLDPRSRPQPAWVPVKLALTDRNGITLLATIITATPGTVSCLVDEARGEILVHALDCADPAAMAADIKARYEAPLLALFP